MEFDVLILHTVDANQVKFDYKLNYVSPSTSDVNCKDAALAINNRLTTNTLVSIERQTTRDITGAN